MSSEGQGTQELDLTKGKALEPKQTQNNPEPQVFCSLVPSWEQVEKLLEEKGLTPESLPIETLYSDGYDGKTTIILAQLAILEVFERYDEDPTGFKLAIPKGVVEKVDGHGKVMRTVAELYLPERNAVAVAPPSYFDDDRTFSVRYQMARRYGIPAYASADYMITYFAAHSTVHHIQRLQDREGKVNKKFKRLKSLEKDSNAIEEYLKLETEQEAHRVGIEVVNDIWRRF